RSGAIVVPLDTRLTPPELSSILADAEPRILFVSSQLAETASALQQQSAFFMEIVVVDKKEGPSHFPELDQLRASTAYEGRERDFDETAVIVYTSGTTGAPKGVMISFRNLGYQ